VSPDHITENQTDHIAVSRKFRWSSTKVRNRRGADVGSDHHLVVTEFQLKIMATGKKFETKGKKFDVQKLQDKRKLAEFKLEFRNRSQALLSPTDGRWTLSQSGSVRDTYLETREKVFGYRNHLQKKCMFKSTWEEIKVRKLPKAKINQSKTWQLKSAAPAEYAESDKRVKRSVRRDKRQWVDEQAQKVEEAERGCKRII
jgi:hypothetical protein